MQKTADLDRNLGKHNSDYQLSHTKQTMKKWIKMLEKSYEKKYWKENKNNVHTRP